jgi:apolipoprotein D and lipocalin family protein
MWKSISILGILLISLQAHSLETVSQLDVDRYQGLWFEMASIPQEFSKDCVSHAQAEYALLEDGLIEVKNSCQEADGSIRVAEGRARPNPNFDSPAKLQVTFVKLITWIWSFAGDYWVIALDDNYQWSVVGHPSLDYLWILSRTPDFDPQQLQEIRSYIESVGYDSCRVLMTKNDSNSYDSPTTLCELEL